MMLPAQVSTVRQSTIAPTGIPGWMSALVTRRGCPPEALLRSHKATEPSLEAVRSLGTLAASAAPGSRLISLTQLLCRRPLSRGLHSSPSLPSCTSLRASAAFQETDHRSEMVNLSPPRLQSCLKVKPVLQRSIHGARCSDTDWLMPDVQPMARMRHQCNSAIQLPKA